MMGKTRRDRMRNGTLWEMARTVEAFVEGSRETTIVVSTHDEYHVVKRTLDLLVERKSGGETAATRTCERDTRDTLKYPNTIILI